MQTVIDLAIFLVTLVVVLYAFYAFFRRQN